MGGVECDLSSGERRVLGFARAILVFIAVAVSLVSFSCPYWAPSFELKLEPNTIVPEQGFAYTTRLEPPALPFPLGFPSDTLGEAASNLQLSENGLLLGPAHALHADILSQGGGRFSHWNNSLYFSTSDGTDPRLNGRAYVAAGRAQLREVFRNAVLLADATIIFLLRGWILARLVLHRRLVVGTVIVGACCAAALLASGAFGVVNPAGGPSAYPGLVVSIVSHVALGCALTLAQWVMGAGVARALLSKTEASYAQIAFLGYPLSLALLAVLTGVALLVPYGPIAAMVFWASCLLPLVRWPIGRAQMQSLVKVLPSLLILSFAFGCWMSLLWHGPTSVIPGAASGDQIFYSSAVWAITANPTLTGWPNLANEGETYSYINFLFPSVGAALARILPLDSFLFICSCAAVAVLGTGLAVHAYLSERRISRIMTLEAAILALGLISAGRTPYWNVVSPPVIFVVPLTFAIWFWVVQARRSNMASSIAVIASIAGSALSKPLSAATLTPLAFSAVIPRLNRMPKVALIVTAILAVVSAGYAARMTVQYLPFFMRMIHVGMTGLGPRSYDLIVHWGYSIRAAWPYLAQDAGIVLMIVAAFRLMNWKESSALALGLILTLVYPFLTWINFVCAAVILALAAIYESAALWRLRRLVIGVFVLISLPMIVADDAGLSTGLIWAAIIAAVVVAAIDATRLETGSSVPAIRAMMASTVLMVTLLMLLAAARGTLVLNSGWPGAAALTPQVRDIWLAVRDRVPPDALIFTDQTGRDPGFTTGWNTYVLNGERQVYIASWYQSAQLQADPDAREIRLRTNEDVLSGRLDPPRVTTSRPYGSFFAVVSIARKPLLDWKLIYANKDHALYKWITQSRKQSYPGPHGSGNQSAGAHVAAGLI
jgi:hypothetical protein